MVATKKNYLNNQVLSKAQAKHKAKHEEKMSPVAKIAGMAADPPLPPLIENNVPEAEWRRIAQQRVAEQARYQSAVSAAQKRALQIKHAVIITLLMSFINIIATPLHGSYVVTAIGIMILIVAMIKFLAEVCCSLSFNIHITLRTRPECDELPLYVSGTWRRSFQIEFVSIEQYAWSSIKRAYWLYSRYMHPPKNDISMGVVNDMIASAREEEPL